MVHTRLTGADVAQLRDLARSMQAAAVRLEGIRASVRSRLHSAPWHGRDVQAFRSEWEGQRSRQLAVTVEGLRRMAAELEHNARQQEEASGAGGAAAAVSVAGASTNREQDLWGVLVGTGASLFKGASTMADWYGRLTDKSSWTGRYTNSWRNVLDLTGGDLLRYKRSEVLQAVRRWDLPSFEGSPVFKALNAFGLAGSVLAVGTETAAVVQALERGDRYGAFDHGVEAVASGLKGSKVPPLFIAGVALDVWKDVGASAGEAWVNHQQYGTDWDAMKFWEGDTFVKLWVGVENPSKDPGTLAVQVGGKLMEGAGDVGKKLFGWFG